MLKPLIMKSTNQVIAAIIFLFLTACSKKEDTLSNTEKLTSGTWKNTAAMYDNDGNGTYETDEYANIAACYKDNYFTFFTGGTMEINEGPAKCDPADPQTETITWQFSNNETSITIGGDTYELLELNNSALKLKQVLGAGRSALIIFAKR